MSQRSGSVAVGESRSQSQSVAYIELTAIASSPFWARCQVRAVLQHWQILPETVKTAELLASELVTNSVKFAGQVPLRPRYVDLEKVQRISLTLRRLPGLIVIEVSDSDPNPPVLADVDWNSENGRGLMLVEALSKEWAYFFPESGGKTVYCVIDTIDPIYLTKDGSSPDQMPRSAPR